jgi:predicted MFS family arabinose efflux permease
LMRSARPATAGEPVPGTAASGAGISDDGPGGEDPHGAEQAGDAAEETSIWRLIRHARELQVIVMIAVLANFVIAGAFEVALPALAHARFGAAGFGALISCFGVGAVAGTLAAARLSRLSRPAQAACAAFLLGSVAIAVMPFLGGLAGAAAAGLVFGAAGSFGNVIIITLLQQWAPPKLLGRVMSLVMLASIGAYPASVALSGVIVGRIGPAPFFPVAGAILGVAVVLGMSQRAFRAFGSTDEGPIDQGDVVSA